ncbi:hypothetical protein [Thermococcus peptonophilus]|uniref:Yip1 domain-containing protein n=1 Tax=Thermococcus peptonophilus TaxID=53952 RepID=A0A142CUV3_9EURY|nr:hypothetical protein [Thermococcus peptonophilus]AMQ18555.1 hypothetical protein A0127_04935 [Thermococcus peptonophilus]
MNSTKKLLMEAILIPLIFWVVMWGLFYLHPSPDLPRENYNVSWLITAAISFFLTLAFVFWYVQRMLRKAGYPQVGFRGLPKVLREADPTIVNSSARDMFIIVLLWGSFSTAVLLKGPKWGIVLTLNFAMAFVVIALPVMVSMMVAVISVSLWLSESLTGKQLSKIFKAILMFSLASGGSLVSLGLLAIHLNVSNTAVIRPLLKIYINRGLYHNLLLLSSLDALYGLAGILLLPRKRKLGLSVLLLIAVAIVPLLVEVFIGLYSTQP